METRPLEQLQQQVVMGIIAALCRFILGLLALVARLVRQICAALLGRPLATESDAEEAAIEAE